MNIWVKKTAQQLNEASEKTQLRKSLSAVDLAALGIGSVVGTGIFVTTGQGALLAGPGVVMAFVMAAITAGLCALTYAELATMYPVAGSTYSYAYAAFGEMIAWIIGWDLMLEYLVSASAVASGWSSTCLGLLQQLGIIIPKSLSVPPMSGGIVDLPAILITVLITWILYLGIRESKHTNNSIVIIKLSVIVLFIILGISHVNPVNLTPFAPFGWKGVMAAAAIIFFAYIGFDAVSTAAEETINPKRDVPLGLLICLSVVIVLYISVALILTGMVPFKEIDVSNALPAALSRIGIQWGGALVATGAIIGMISTLLITLYGQVRIFMVMARDGLLPKAFAAIHEKHKTPHICTWITGFATAFIAGFFPLPIIIELCNIGTFFAFIVVSVGVIVLRKTHPDVERKFKVPGVPFTPLLTIAFCIYMMYSLPFMTWVRFGLWLAVGLVIYFVYSVKKSKMQATM